MVALDKELFDFGLPENWKIACLSDYTEKPQYGYTDSAANEGNTKFLRITDITNSGVDWDTVPFCNCPEEKIDNYLLKDNDIVFARIGATTGKSFFINNPPNAVYASYLIRIRVKDGLEPKFLYFYFNSDFYWKQINYNKGTSLKGGVNGSILSKLKVIIPKSSEQQKIAHILSKIQSAIEKQEAIIKTTTELKKALMHKLFTEGLNGEPQKETEIGPVPENWDVKRVDEIYKYTSKPRSIDIKRYSEVPFIPMDYIPLDKIEITNFNLKNGKKLSSGTYVENGDFLLAKITPSFENGKQGILNISEDFGYATTEVIPIKGINGVSEIMFLFYFLQQDDVRNELTGKMEGSTGRQRLSKTVLGTKLMPVPPVDEQEEIAKILKQLDLKVISLRKKIDTLTELFKSMLHNLMTGQIRVNNIKFDNIQEN